MYDSRNVKIWTKIIGAPGSFYTASSLGIEDDEVDLARYTNAALTEVEFTTPPRDKTATSEVPPPISTTIEPVGSDTGRPAPIAAATGSSIR